MRWLSSRARGVIFADRNAMVRETDPLIVLDFDHFQ